MSVTEQRRYLAVINGFASVLWPETATARGTSQKTDVSRCADRLTQEQVECTEGGPARY